MYVYGSTHAPLSWLLKKLSSLMLVRLPMDAGMAPAHGLVSFCVCLVQHTRTLKLVLHEIEPLQVREVADGRRDGACARAREFLCMSGSTHAPLSLLLLRSSVRRFVRLPMDAGMAPAHRLMSFVLMISNSGRTSEAAFLYVQVFQVHEAAD